MFQHSTDHLGDSSLLYRCVSTYRRFGRYCRIRSLQVQRAFLYSLILKVEALFLRNVGSYMTAYTS